MDPPARQELQLCPSEFARDFLDSEAPDHIVIATGADAYAPPVEGDGSVPVITGDGPMTIADVSGRHVLVVDADGYYWITGRVDDVLNVSGHRLGTAEVESALVAHPAVAEAAVVGYPHDIKGEGIYAYVTLVLGREPNDELLTELRLWVRKEIGPIATPDLLQWAPSLPKTRSGKIMRRILRKIAANDFENLGDTSTLAEPDVVRQLVDNRLNR